MHIKSFHSVLWWTSWMSRILVSHGWDIISFFLFCYWIWISLHFPRYQEMLMEKLLDVHFSMQPNISRELKNQHYVIEDRVPSHAMYFQVWNASFSLSSAFTTNYFYYITTPFFCSGDYWKHVVISKGIKWNPISIVLEIHDEASTNWTVFIFIYILKKIIRYKIVIFNQILKYPIYIHEYIFLYWIYLYIK